MNLQWQQRSFAELSQRGELAFGDGYRAKLDELGGNGPIFLRAGMLSESGFDWAGPERFIEELSGRLASKMGFPGDTMITTKGNSVGRTAYVQHDAPEFVYSPHLSFWRSLDHGRIEPGFLRYWSQGSEFRRQLHAMAHGTDMAPYLSLADQKRLVVTLPDIGSQRGIAATLGALDDKIESNRRAASLETRLAIATLSSGATRVRVGDVANVSKGLSYKGSGLSDPATEGALPMLNLANFTTTAQLRAAGLKHYVGEFKPKHCRAAWDLLVANTDLTQNREILGRGFLVPPSLDGSLHTHHTSAVEFFDHLEFGLVLWAQLQTPGFRERARGFATGTTVSALPAEAILDFEFSVPDDLDRALLTARALVTHSWQLDAESASLVALREALLPELLSGRIRVPEAGEAIA